MSGIRFRIQFTFQGVQQAVEVSESDPDVEELAKKIQAATGLSYTTLKLLGPGLKGALLLAANKGMRASEAGILHGKQYMALGSPQNEVDSVRHARDLPGLMGFEAEVKRAASRRRSKVHTNPKPPGGKFTFSDYKVLDIPGANPVPSEALKTLYRLASDPGILGIMKDRQWRVGLLSEMPPEGKVGISEKCLLGYNVNKGQEISLRLRTDDLKGLRKYRAVRDTLLHELAHMIWSEHDYNFKMLNSELSHQCERLNAQSVSGVFLGGDDALGPQSSDEMDMDLGVEQDGHKLGGNHHFSSPQEAARSAAFERMLKADKSFAGLEEETKPSKQPFVSSESTTDRRPARQPMEVLHDGTRMPDPLNSILPQRFELHPIGDYASEQLADTPSTSAGGHSPSPMQIEDFVAPHNIQEVQEIGLDTSGAQLNDSSDAGRSAGPSGSGDHKVQSESAEYTAMEREPIEQVQLPGVFPTADPAMERAQKVQEAVDSLVSVSGREASNNLQTVEKIFNNALQNPGVEKFRSIRVNNQAFHKRLGRHPVSLDLMKLVGFVEEGDPLDPVVRLRRQDPGLLWLGLSVVKQSLDRLS